jgi:hypothetical protein
MMEEEEKEEGRDDIQIQETRCRTFGWGRCCSFMMQSMSMDRS